MFCIFHLLGFSKFALVDWRIWFRVLDGRRLACDEGAVLPRELLLLRTNGISFIQLGLPLILQDLKPNLYGNAFTPRRDLAADFLFLPLQPDELWSCNDDDA